MVEYDGGGGGATSTYEYKIPGAAQTASAQKQKGQEPENLWNSILEDVVKRDDTEDSYLIMLGNPGVGKRSIVREINAKYVQSRNKSLKVEEMCSDYSALDFSFLYVKDLMD